MSAKTTQFIEILINGNTRYNNPTEYANYITKETKKLIESSFDVKIEDYKITPITINDNSASSLSTLIKRNNNTYSYNSKRCSIIITLSKGEFNITKKDTGLFEAILAVYNFGSNALNARVIEGSQLAYTANLWNSRYKNGAILKNDWRKHVEEISKPIFTLILACAWIKNETFVKAANFLGISPEKIDSFRGYSSKLEYEDIKLRRREFKNFKEILKKAEITFDD